MKSALVQDSGLAVRPTVNLVFSDIQMSLWDALDVGVLVTDLHHLSLICNRKFGEIFEIEPGRVVTSSVQGLRNLVSPRISDASDWEANLEQIYNNPMMTQRDHILLSPGTRTIERYSAPVIGKDGGPLYRMWTFRFLDKADRTVLVCGSLTLRPECRQAMIKGNRADFTRIEFELLRFLVCNANSAVSREQLFRHVWGYELEMNTNSLDVLISRLRKKLNSVDSPDVLIETVYGFGYRLKAVC